MTVSELIKKLSDFNQQAKAGIVAHGKVYEFGFSWGDSEGCDKKSCTAVNLYVDELNTLENQEKH